MSTFLIKDDAGNVINRIEADQAFMEENYPGRWELDLLSVPEPSPPDSRLSRLAFRNRFTTAEKVALELASIDDPSASSQQRQQAAMLRVYLKDVDAASFVDLADASTISGVYALESAGLLEPGRSGEILLNPISDEERP